MQRNANKDETKIIKSQQTMWKVYKKERQNIFFLIFATFKNTPDFTGCEKLQQPKQ